MTWQDFNAVVSLPARRRLGMLGRRNPPAPSPPPISIPTPFSPPSEKRTTPFPPRHFRTFEPLRLAHCRLAAYSARLGRLGPSRRRSSVAGPSGGTRVGQAVIVLDAPLSNDGRGAAPTRRMPSRYGRARWLLDRPGLHTRVKGQLVRLAGSPSSVPRASISGTRPRSRGCPC